MAGILVLVINIANGKWVVVAKVPPYMANIIVTLSNITISRKDDDKIAILLLEFSGDLRGRDVATAAVASVFSTITLYSILLLVVVCGRRIRSIKAPRMK